MVCMVRWYGTIPYQSREGSSQTFCIKTMKFSLFRTTVFVLVALSSVWASEVSDLTGYWLGTLGDDGGEDGSLRLLFRIYQEEEMNNRVALYSLDQGSDRLPAHQVSYANDHLTLYFDDINGRFEGDVDDSKEVVTGTWHQAGLSISLTIRRFISKDPKAVPREFNFLLKKIVSGETDSLQKMVGYWSGYLNDSWDEPNPEPPELVILHMEKINEELVEPKVFLPDEQAFPVGLRSVFVNQNKEVKIVLDDPISQNNAIFHAKWEGNKLTGVVEYDDDDYTPPLVLEWSPTRPEVSITGRE